MVISLQVIYETDYSQPQKNTKYISYHNVLLFFFFKKKLYGLLEKGYWKGLSLSIIPYWQGPSLSIICYWQGLSLSIIRNRQGPHTALPWVQFRQIIFFWFLMLKWYFLYWICISRGLKYIFLRKCKILPKIEHFVEKEDEKWAKFSYLKKWE